MPHVQAWHLAYLAERSFGIRTPSCLPFVNSTPVDLRARFTASLHPAVKWQEIRLHASVRPPDASAAALHTDELAASRDRRSGAAVCGPIKKPAARTAALFGTASVRFFAILIALTVNACPRRPAIFGMFPDPIDISLKRVAETMEVLVELHALIEEGEVEAGERLRRTSLSSTFSKTSGAKRLERGDGSLSRRTRYAVVNLNDRTIETYRELRAFIRRYEICWAIHTNGRSSDQ